jgi:hypothetical protein
MNSVGLKRSVRTRVVNENAKALLHRSSSCRPAASKCAASKRPRITSIPKTDLTKLFGYKRSWQ